MGLCVFAYLIIRVAFGILNGLGNSLKWSFRTTFFIDILFDWIHGLWLIVVTILAVLVVGLQLFAHT